jgi:hypothetical protein
MRVISTTDLSREGNDCYIYESVSLIESFGMYTVIMAVKTVGWIDRKDIYCKSDITSDFEQAKYMYKQAGGILEE